MSSGRAHPPHVVTLSAPYGAGGSLVGPRLAERLEVPFLDRAIPAAVSTRLHVPVEEARTHEELSQGTWSSWLSHFAPAVQMFAGAGLAREVNPVEEESFRIATEQVLRELAATGAVILGRAAAIVLRDVPEALHVRLNGSRERRIAQAMRLEGLDASTAEQELRKSDLSREAYVRRWYRLDPGDPSLYHLLIDSTSIEFDGCVDIIARALGSRTRPLD